MMKMNSVIFDMDGVLLDSEKIWDWAWKKYADELKLNNVERSCNACRGCNGEEQKKSCIRFMVLILMQKNFLHRLLIIFMIMKKKMVFQKNIMLVKYLNI